MFLTLPGVGTLKYSCISAVLLKQKQKKKETCTGKNHVLVLKTVITRKVGELKLLTGSHLVTETCQ